MSTVPTVPTAPTAPTAPTVPTTIEHYISIIPEQFDGEWYARGQSYINCGTGIFGDDTFIARNRHTEAYI